MIRSWIFSLICLLVNSDLNAQAYNGIGKCQEILDIFARFQLKYSTTKTSIDFNFIDGFKAQEVIGSLDSNITSSKEKSDIDYLKNHYWAFFPQEYSESNKVKVFGTSQNFLSYQNDDIYFTINPALLVSFGDDTQDDNVIFRNTRGIKISGGIKNKLFFHTNIYESQARFLSHMENKIARRNAIPGQGFYKTFQSGIFDNLIGWDFLNAEAVVTYRPSKFFRTSIGHGNFFLGTGYHSLLLSDYSDNFFFLELNTSIGNVNYKNIFAELAPQGSTIDQPGDNLAPKKYMVAHYLTIKPHQNFEFSLFEAVIFGRENQFELQYLNPLILYRVIEQKLDSPDNVMIGLDFAYRIEKTMLLYGQLVIDELRTGEFFKASGWWGNKMGFQLGLKYPDLFSIDHFDLRVEYNSVRPYTYSHRYLREDDEFVIGAYSHYNQELAHPLGANFNEALVTLKYKINSNWNASAKVIMATNGSDEFSNLNYGSDILKPNDTRVQDFDNRINQGLHSTIFQLGYTLTYMPYQNYYVDLKFLYRNLHFARDLPDRKSVYFGFSLRANMLHQKLDY